MLNFDAKEIQKELLKRASKGVTQSIPVLMEELKRLTPEDTKEMLNSYKKIDTKQTPDTITSGITNTADHAIIVEYGEDRPYDYHKPAGPEPRPVIYTGIGNRTFARSIDNKRVQITSIIAKSLG